jgi:hypothetical protein
MKYLEQNYTLDVELWNTSERVARLDNDRVLPGAGNLGNYTWEHTYTGISELTDRVGSRDYTLKVIDTGSGLMVASTGLSVLTAGESISLSVSWDDANDDRKIETAESVVCTQFITWTFVNESDSMSLYVVEGEGDPQLIDAVSVTAGSGSASKTWTNAWTVSGVKELSFILRNSDNEVEATVDLDLTVGAASTSPGPSVSTPPYEPLTPATWTQIIGKNIYVILIFLIVLAGAYVWIKS